MNARVLILPVLLALGAAQAQSTTAPTAPTTTTTFDVKANLATLKSLAAGGATVTVVDKEGNPLATVQADGTLKITDGADLSRAAAVTVLPKGAAEGAEPTRYTLTTTLDREGQPKVTVTNAAGKDISVALPAAVNRAAQGAQKAETPDAPDTDDTAATAPAGKGKPRK
ncbi:hypothetical protein [Deinococcus pimensis]|uniref:hypothetical protein n=1 Tax=Deinococcus pimensis TaxID=309888 RepID=UPI0004887313|nr:hypothetical protein [Deinococcus pimensis]